MKQIVKCGEKGRHLEIPEGYQELSKNVVVTEQMAPNCLVADIVHLCWIPLDEEDIGMRAYVIGDHVIEKR